MNCKFLFLGAVFVLTGCKDLGSQGDSGVGKTCTQMGSSFDLRVQVKSSTPLPAYLAVALNGASSNVDECGGEISFSGGVEVSADRFEATVVINLDGDPSAFFVYFPDGSSEPQSNLASLSFLSRGTCADAPAEFNQLHDQQITWEPVYANGKSCGVTSHRGTVNVQF